MGGYIQNAERGKMPENLFKNESKRRKSKI
jgi:hypothetical protein